MPGPDEHDRDVGVQRLDLTTGIKCWEAVAGEDGVGGRRLHGHRAGRKAGAERGLSRPSHAAKPRDRSGSHDYKDTVLVELRDAPLTASELPDGLPLCPGAHSGERRS